MASIFEMLAKVLIVLVVSAIALPYMFGFVSGLFNSIKAGYVMGYLTGCISIYAIGAIIVKSIRRYIAAGDTE